MTGKNEHLMSLSMAGLVGLAPSQALAYIGPGAGLGAILLTVGLVLGFVLLLGGFVWYPLKRRLASRKLASRNDQAENRTIPEKAD